MTKHIYRVERHMLGDRPFAPGDKRELLPGDAAHLVKSGVLTDLGPVKNKKAPAKPSGKASKPHSNKAEPPLNDKAGGAGGTDTAANTTTNNT